MQREQGEIVPGAYCELLRELCDFCNKSPPLLFRRQGETVPKWHTCGVHKVLFIEDDDAIRLALRLALEDEGYEVVEAHDGASGLVQFGQCRPDVVLLDLRLPDLSGFEVCKAIRSSSTVPIIMVTAQTEAADMVAGLEAGADDYITTDNEASIFFKRKKDLVYLTADSPFEISTLNENDIYIIGGFIDRNRHKMKTLNKAEALGIRHARLPINDFPQMKSSSVLTVNQCFEILVTQLEMNDWKQTIERSVPRRKIAAAAKEKLAEAPKTMTASKIPINVDKAVVDGFTDYGELSD